jgi:hypothetical protein
MLLPKVLLLGGEAGHPEAGARAGVPRLPGPREGLKLLPRDHGGVLTRVDEETVPGRGACGEGPGEDGGGGDGDEGRIVGRSGEAGLSGDLEDAVGVAEEEEESGSFDLGDGGPGLGAGPDVEEVAGGEGGHGAEDVVELAGGVGAGAGATDPEVEAVGEAGHGGGN